MTKKNQSSVERLKDQFPEIAPELGDAAMRVDAAHEIAVDISATERKLWDLRPQLRNKLIDRNTSLDNVVSSLLENGSLSLLEKISLAEALQLACGNSGEFSEGVFQEIEKRHMSVLPSLKAVERITKHDGQPILYFQAHGSREKYEPATVGFIFEGQTNGSGIDVDIHTDGLFGRRYISFGIRDYGPGIPKNFTSGYLSTESQELGITRVGELAGTVTRARQIMQDSRHNLQTNPVFVGEKACGVAKQILVEKQTHQRSAFEIIS